MPNIGINQEILNKLYFVLRQNVITDAFVDLEMAGRTYKRLVLGLCTVLFTAIWTWFTVSACILLYKEVKGNWTVLKLRVPFNANAECMNYRGCLVKKIKIKLRCSQLVVEM